MAATLCTYSHHALSDNTSIADLQQQKDQPPSCHFRVMSRQVPWVTAIILGQAAASSRSRQLQQIAAVNTP